MLNRRSFLRRIGAAIVGAAAPRLALADTPTPLFTEFVPVDRVGEFEVIYYWQGELICHPADRCFVIADVAE